MSALDERLFKDHLNILLNGPFKEYSNDLPLTIEFLRALHNKLIEDTNITK